MSRKQADETNGLEELRRDLLDLSITLSSGKTYEIDLAESLSECAEDPTTIPEEVSFYGKLLGALERETLLAEMGYRRWRAATTLELLEENEKLSEWKIRAEVEADEQFEERKRVIADAARSTNAIRAHINALLILGGRADLTTPLSAPHEAKGK